MVLLAGVSNAAEFSALQAAAADQPAGQISEVVVTAQRREQNQQDVPIAITTVTAQTLAAVGIANSTDLQLVVPGVDMSRQNVSALPFIRGIGTSNSAPGDENSVVTFIDGVYVAAPSASIFRLHDVERVEVLKGPQGTLFGRNASGGVINIITRDPQDRATLDLSTGYAEFDQVEASLYGQTPVGSGLATNLSISYLDQGEGWGKNVLSGREIHSASDLSVRNKWVWKPRDGTDVKVSFDYAESEPASGLDFGIIEGSTAADGTEFVCFYCSSSGSIDRVENSQWGASIHLRQHVGFADLVGISSYRRTRSRFRLQQFGTAVPLSSLDIEQPSRTVTQEIQLQSPTSPTFEWIAGLYYFDDEAGFDPLIVPEAGINLVSIETSQSYAAFGQATLRLLDRTSVTGGLRYTRDERRLQASIPGVLVLPEQAENFDKLTWRASIDYRGSEELLLFGSLSRGFKSGLFNTVSPGAAPVRPETVDAYEVGFKSDLLLRRLRLNGSVFLYEVQDQQVLSVTGFGTTALVNAAESTIKGAELELSASPTARLNVSAAVSYLDGKFDRFPNAPIYTPCLSLNPATLSPQSTCLIVPGALGTSMILGGNDLSSASATGKPTVRSPKWTAVLGAKYTLATRTGTFVLSGNYYYNEGFNFTPSGRVQQPAYDLLNAAISWTSPRGRWDVTLFGRNLLDEEYFAYALEQAFADNYSPASPRSVGISVGYHVGR
jgi:iron complex outermembrane receptor protein